MLRKTGFVFDQYDDVGGRVFRALVPHSEDVPDFVKSAQYLGGGAGDRLADDQYALVMLDEGRKMRKYATIDKGNTALSVTYLLKQAHLLPPEAIKVAATNLVGACLRHGLPVSEHLKLAAETGLSRVSGKSQSLYAKNYKVNRIQFPPKENPKESTENPQLGRHEDRDAKERTNYTGVQGNNFLELPVFSQKEKQKDQVGNVEKRASVEARTRHKEWRTSPYVDVSSWDPSSATVEDHASPTRTLLGDKYPVDSYEQTKMAAAYFQENWKAFHPSDRHEYCVKLAERMAELDMEVPDNIERYGSTGYAANVDSLVASRKPLVQPELVPALDTLIEKRAHVSPETFVQAVAEFDKIAGLEYFWTAQVPDPWFTTYGPSMEKLAELSWSFDEQGVRIGLSELESLARNGKHALKRQFGADFVEEFAKKPKVVFESLPKFNKLMLARMASDRHSGTATE